MVHTTTRWRLLAITPLLLIALIFSAREASADIRLADFENNLNTPYVDSASAPIDWQVISGTSVYSTTTGVTAGTSSLELTVPVDWNETLLLESEQVIADLAQGTVLAMDVNAPGGSTTDTDWVSFQFVVNGEFQAWTGSPSLYDNNATGDGDVTVTWDYSALSFNSAEPWYELQVVVNAGEARTLFIDNIRVLTASDPGDFDSDGDVDGADFLEWQRTDATVAGLSDWQAGYPSATLSSLSAVPEPASLGLISLAMLLISANRPRHRV